MEIYFCEKCGNVMQEKDRFCPKCGAERMMDGAEMKIVLPYGVAKLTVEFAEKLKPAEFASKRRVEFAPVTETADEPAPVLTDEELAAVVVPDEDHWKALEYVVGQKFLSISLLQRALGLGYAKAGHIIEWMEENKFVGRFRGAKQRPVYLTREQLAKIKHKGND